MFIKRYHPSISLIGGAAIALLAVTGISQQANAQQPIRSNIAPRPVRSNLVPGTVEFDQLSPSAQTALQNAATELGTTTQELLQNQRINSLLQSSTGSEVLNSLVAADGIGPAPDFEVQSVVPRVNGESPESAVSVFPVQAPQGVSVEGTLNILSAE
jgi:hypothetical protein